jgi:shikimate dehydrogenase
MRVFGLIGYPLTHSFSGNYFEQKFRSLGLHDHVYNLYPLSELTDFRTWVDGIEGLVGLNVTIPHKQSVLSFLDRSCLPQGLPACNCIHIVNREMIGYNTDVIGFTESLKPLLRSHHTNALVLGHGGAAEAVFHVLRKMGIQYRVVGRSEKPGVDLTYDQLTPVLIRQHALIIQTTPLGTYPNAEARPPIPYEGITSDHLLYDLVYNPSKTAFLAAGELQGATIQNGLQMLELQAEAAWSIWNGIDLS